MYYITFHGRGKNQSDRLEVPQLAQLARKINTLKKNCHLLSISLLQGPFDTLLYASLIGGFFTGLAIFWPNPVKTR